ncbi:hypothetical protein OQA88_3346 [Cercophora sp. LCS_1]
MTASSLGGAAAAPYGSVSPRTDKRPSRALTFVLKIHNDDRARLPLRVAIYPHDTTESIVTTVRNFFGIYSGPGATSRLVFENENGEALIAQYENFRDKMTVFVQVLDEIPDLNGGFPGHFRSPSIGAPLYNDYYAMQAPQYAPYVSRPGSGASRVRSPSPNGGRGRRSLSAGMNQAGSKKGRSRSAKSRANGSQTNGDDMNGYSSGNDAPGSSSGKSKEQLGNTEISVENIVEGGRRKRAKFESSELPLFAPPQMPAATSNASASPARRNDQHRNSLPFVHPGQNPFTNAQVLHSPQSYSHGYAHPGMYATPGVDSRRASGFRGGVMPTPDPTVGSCMSEEDKDVAMQLMRLGDISNISHGRTSASTLDDTFSGRADAASSTGATSDAEDDGEDEAPPPRRQKLDAAGHHKKTFSTTDAHFVGPIESVETSDNDADYDDTPEHGSMAAPRLKSPKQKSSSINGSKPRTQLPKLKTTKQAKPKLKKAASTGPMSPASLPASRKQSIASNPAMPSMPGEDEQPDLSTKPRCQRCRKSKKGCDRQRPCGRCRDAGLSAEMCISEDEGNGRKGRYGRHMGVPIKTDEMPAPDALLPAAPIATAADVLAPMSGALDKNGKKRKR